MKVQTLREQGKLSKVFIEADGGAFIVPNPASVIIKHLDGVVKNFKGLCDLNGWDYSPDDRAVDVWFHSKELDSENLNGHGVHLEVGNEVVHFRPYALNLIPASILRGHNEGDTLDIKVEGVGTVSGVDRYKVPVTMNLKVELKQKGFRYTGFGMFQEVLEHVTR